SPLQLPVLGRHHLLLARLPQDPALGHHEMVLPHSVRLLAPATGARHPGDREAPQRLFGVYDPPHHYLSLDRILLLVQPDLGRACRPVCNGLFGYRLGRLQDAQVHAQGPGRRCRVRVLCHHVDHVPPLLLRIDYLVRLYGGTR
ncbi:hypothetical protein BGZ52_013273, partial [Haplosporangium bisporale]